MTRDREALCSERLEHSDRVEESFAGLPSYMLIFEDTHSQYYYRLGLDEHRLVEDHHLRMRKYWSDVSMFNYQFHQDSCSSMYSSFLIQGQ
jgi:hypothetical protein